MAGDFFGVESVLLRGRYVLFFIEIGSRRVWLAGVTGQPTGEWVTRQARTVAAAVEERGVVARHRIRDRDIKFSRAFDEVWRSIGVQIIRTPVGTPVANAFAGRWVVGTVRRECLDHLLVAGRHHLGRVLAVYLGHYNQHRRRGLGLAAPDSRPSRRDNPCDARAASASRRPRRTHSRVRARRSVAIDF